MKTALTLALAATTALVLTASAHAQAAAPAAMPASGPPINGVCVFSSERAVGTSAVGLSVQTRLKQLAQLVDAELNVEAQSLQQEQAAIQAARTTMSQDQFNQRAQAWGAKYQALQRKGQQRAQELDATRAKQLQRIGESLDPVLKEVYVQRNCSMLLNADATFGIFNTQMDLTPTVIDKLNTKITTLSFDREHIEPQGGAPSVAAAAAPQPAAAPRKKK